MSREVTTIALQEDSPGQQHSLQVHRFTGKDRSAGKVFIQAALHADEIPAHMAVHHLLRQLIDLDEQGKINGEIIVLPYANPIGLGQYIEETHLGRYHLPGGGNFNRNWPDLAELSLPLVKDKLGTDAETNVETIRSAMRQVLNDWQTVGGWQHLRKEILTLACDADVVLDVHCDDESLIHLFIAPQHWPQLSDLSAAIKSRATMMAEDSGGGSFDEACSYPWVKFAKAFPECNIPPVCEAATVELRGRPDVYDALGEEDAEGLLTFLSGRGFISGRESSLPKPLCDATDLRTCDIVRSPGAGVLAYKVKPGDTVSKGQVVAELIDIASPDPRDARIEIKSINDGLVISTSQNKLVRLGYSIAKINGTEILESRSGYLLED